MLKTQTSTGITLDLIQPIVSNNSAGFAHKIGAAADKLAATLGRATSPSPFMKRAICASAECMTCPYARNNGSC